MTGFFVFPSIFLSSLDTNFFKSNLKVTHLFLRNSSCHYPQSVHNVSKCPFCTWDRSFCLTAIDLYMLYEICGCRAIFSLLLQFCTHQDKLKNKWLGWVSRPLIYICQAKTSTIFQFSMKQTPFYSAPSIFAVLRNLVGEIWFDNSG